MRDLGNGGLELPELEVLGGYRIADPYLFYARARREAPVLFSPTLRMWLVTRYDDICAILKDPVRFSSAEALPVVRAGEAPPEVREILRQTFPRPPTLPDIDPPAHTRIRGLLNKAFTPQRVAEMKPAIRAIAHELVDGFAMDGHVDIVPRFSHRLPLITIIRLAGVPMADVDRVKEWCDVIGLGRPYQPLDRQIAMAHATVAIQRYFMDLLARRRAAPQDELLDDLLRLEEQGRPALSDPELVAILRMLTFAGHESTAHLISSALLHLLSEPSRWRLLRDDPSLLPSAIEEALRFDSSILFLVRTTTTDVEVAGVSLPAGARLMIMFGSANRDEAHFPAADTFDLSRKPDCPHLGFGRGIHFCLGAALARLQIRIALEVLGERLPGLRLSPDQALSYVPDLHLRGLEHLHLRWAPAPG